MLTGERDPLVDDTVIFAGRLRQAKRAEWVFGKEMGLDWARGEFHEEDWVNVDLIPGISHGFLQFVGVFPEGWKYILRCGKWMEEAFERRDELQDGAMNGELDTSTIYDRDRHRHPHERSDYFGSGATVGLAEAVNGLSNGRSRHHHRSGTASSADEDRPLEMTVLRKPSDSKAKDKSSPPKSNGQFLKGEQHTNAKDSGVSTASSRGRGRARGKKDARRKSLVSLASEDDLLGRRMKGLTGSLMGEVPLDEDV